MYQKVIIVGNLGGDPVLRYTPDGTPVATFSVATSEKWTDKDGEKQEKTTWWKVTAWRRLGETCNEYLTQGKQVLVEGHASVSAYTDKKSGEPKASLELRADVVRFLGGKQTDPVEG